MKLDGTGISLDIETSIDVDLIKDSEFAPISM